MDKNGQNSPTDDHCAENNQPDVIKAASAANKSVSADSVSKDIANLQKENEALACKLRRHALGFNAMATLVDHLANHYGIIGVVESNNRLKKNVTSLQHSVENKKQEIGKYHKKYFDRNIVGLFI